MEEKRTWKNVLKRMVLVVLGVAVVAILGAAIYTGVTSPDSVGMSFSDKMRLAAEYKGKEITAEEIEAARVDFLKIMVPVVVLNVIVGVGLVFAHVRSYIKRRCLFSHDVQNKEDMCE